MPWIRNNQKAAAVLLLTNERRCLKQFVLRMGAFLAPLAACAVIICLVDPFNFFNFCPLIPTRVKDPVSNLHYVLWKMPEYRRKPVENILLGDSRMGAVRAELVEEISGEHYYNFSYGGASLAEIIKTFWFADNLIQLKNVYIGINFNLYNSHVNGDRTQDYEHITQNPLLYVINPTVLEATWYDIKSVLGAKVNIGVPDMTREYFWKYQLEITASQMYRQYDYPRNYQMQLARIAEHCKDKGINLVFIVFPTHTDLQKRISDFGLQSNYQQFLLNLAKLGTTFNYDFPNTVTKDLRNFKDPFHFQDEIMRLLVKDIWGHQSVLPVQHLGYTAPVTLQTSDSSGTNSGATALSCDTVFSTQDKR